MTWTYGNAPGTSTAAERRDAVRYLVGDTDSTMSPTLSDEEIAFSLSRSGNSVMAAAIAACRSLSAKWALIPTTTVVGVGSVQAGEVSKRLLETMKTLQADAATGAAPVFGGQSVTENKRLAALTDVPQPTFRNGQDDPLGSSYRPAFPAQGVW